MRSRLKPYITSPPQGFASEPISVADAKSWCDIPDADTTRDLLIGTLISAAREVAELRQGRDLVVKYWELTTDCFPCHFQLRENASSVDSLRYRDSDGVWHDLTQDMDFLFDSVEWTVGRTYGGSWPSFTPYPTSAVVLRYTVTPPTPDQQVLMGMRYLVSQWYVNRIPAEAAGSTIQQFPYCLGLLDHGKVEAV